MGQTLFKVKAGVNIIVGIIDYITLIAAPWSNESVENASELKKWLFWLPTCGYATYILAGATMVDFITVGNKFFGLGLALVFGFFLKLYEFAFMSVLLDINNRFDLLAEIFGGIMVFILVALGYGGVFWKKMEYDTDTYWVAFGIGMSLVILLPSVYGGLVFGFNFNTFLDQLLEDEWTFFAEVVTDIHIALALIGAIFCCKQCNIK